MFEFSNNAGILALNNSIFLTMTKQVKNIVLLILLLQLSSTATAQNSWGFGNTNYSLTGWWKIKAAVPVNIGSMTLNMPLWGYVGLLDNKTGETWECGHDGQNCIPGTLSKFSWAEASGNLMWTDAQGNSGTTIITWIDKNTFTTLDSKGRYLKTYYRAVNEEDAKCFWHMAIWNANCYHLSTSCQGHRPDPDQSGCGSCQNGCRDCFTCSGTGQVWDSQVGKWYPCMAHGCGVFAPKGKICK